MRGVIGRVRLLSPRSARRSAPGRRGLVTTFFTAFKAVIAVARELAGFVWATGQLVQMTIAARRTKGTGRVHDLRSPWTGSPNLSY
jgi:hypothetical protein